jgi:DNA invertase Pin-like site-specific DNA recombinase
VVLVWRYDRFARSTQALISALKEFQALGIDFISHQEQIDTTIPQGEMVFGFMASLAQFESSLISERVKAGMQRAKEEGRKESMSDDRPFLKTRRRKPNGSTSKRTSRSTRFPSGSTSSTAPSGTTSRRSKASDRGDTAVP